MANVLVPLAMFVVGVGIVYGGYHVLVWLPGALTKRRIDQRLGELSAPVDPQAVDSDVAAILVKRQVVGVLPPVDRLVCRTAWGAKLAGLIEQAGKRIGVSTVLLIAVVGAMVGGLLLAVIMRAAWAFVPGAIAGFSAPFVVLLRTRSRRLRQFEEQFPDALDLLSRAIRAGHAFTTSMGMVADEAADPIGAEFRKTFDEQNFGLPLKDALTNLAERVPLMDVRFFVTAVLIQRETGGNLSEILDNLSHVVRERFKILRQVRVYTAHGRLTGYVLMGLPAALAIALSFINPEHMALLFNERMGKMMIVGAIVMQTVGYFWIQKVIKIEV
jgi:tight adherence protein B